MSFVGRVMELAQLEAMLASGEGRIITITGPGGVGKSRLARELIKRVARHDAGEVPWVALADLTTAADSIARLAEQIGLQLAPARDAKAQLVAALATRQGTIVLDNAEHLDDLPALLLELQRASPRATWLVTSRLPLGIDGERTYALDGMESPEAGERVEGFEQAANFESMRLLESRAQALDPDFDLSEQWQPCLELVRAVGGWPLAIELAASAVTQHGVAAALGELQRSIDALAVGHSSRQARHDSMRASLSLSWRLLGPEEESALAALSVFRGGFTRAAAVVIGACSSVTLARLVERSLVQVGGGGRFDLHPLVAQFAAERLAADEPRQVAVARRHAEHFASRLQACVASGVQIAAPLLQEIAIDFENVRSAWATLVATGDASAPRRIGARLVGLRHGQGADARAGAARRRGHARSRRPTSRRAIRCLQAAAILHFRSGELDSAQALANDALAAAVAAGDRGRSTLHAQHPGAGAEGPGPIRRGRALRSRRAATLSGRRR